jgi:hypothetical protein
MHRAVETKGQLIDCQPGGQGIAGTSHERAIVQCILETQIDVSDFDGKKQSGQEKIAMILKPRHRRLSRPRDGKPGFSSDIKEYHVQAR